MAGIVEKRVESELDKPKKNVFALSSSHGERMVRMLFPEAISKDITINEPQFQIEVNALGEKYPQIRKLFSFAEKEKGVEAQFSAEALTEIMNPQNEVFMKEGSSLMAQELSTLTNAFYVISTQVEKIVAKSDFVSENGLTDNLSKSLGTAIRSLREMGSNILTVNQVLQETRKWSSDAKSALNAENIKDASVDRAVGINLKTVKPEANETDFEDTLNTKQQKLFEVVMTHHRLRQTLIKLRDVLVKFSDVIGKVHRNDESPLLPTLVEQSKSLSSLLDQVLAA